jgi:SAM-dependent methyltransferase
MKQNVYDDPQFFEGYRKLRDSDSGLNGAVEEPAIRTILPDLRGRSVLDLGSGFGDFCRFAEAQGAATVLGVELSLRMIEVAKNRTVEGRIKYVNSAIEDFAVRPATYDVVVSCLALHYVRDYGAVVRSVYAGLRTGGSFIFSVEHPVCTALCNGWYKHEGGNQTFWPVDNYSVEGERKQHWFVDGVVKYHRTVETYVNTVLDSGFILARLLEPYASRECVEKQPDLKSTSRRPPILVIAASKRPNIPRQVPAAAPGS